MKNQIVIIMLFCLILSFLFSFTFQSEIRPNETGNLPGIDTGMDCLKTQFLSNGQNQHPFDSGNRIITGYELQYKEINFYIP